MIVLAEISAHTYWWIALGIGLVAALIVAALLIALIITVRRIESTVDGLLGTATELAGQTEHIPELNATAPVLEQIVDEALVQNDYMNALTDGFGEQPERRPQAEPQAQ